MSKWSTPFYGIQHLAGLKPRFQVTVTNYETFAECSVFVPGCGFNATDTNHETVAAAIAHGEAQASMIGARA